MVAAKKVSEFSSSKLLKMRGISVLPASRSRQSLWCLQWCAFSQAYDLGYDYIALAVYPSWAVPKHTLPTCSSWHIPNTEHASEAALGCPSAGALESSVPRVLEEAAGPESGAVSWCISG